MDTSLDEQDELDLETAIRTIIWHADIGQDHGFMGRVLRWQMTADLQRDRLDENCAQLIECLEVLHQESRRDDGLATNRDVCLSISLILANAWEQHRWWTRHEHLPPDFLDRFADHVADLGFVWTRYLDGSVASLSEALAERRTEAAT
jgi:hypothetical protein